jgi:hypothetical protein
LSFEEIPGEDVSRFLTERSHYSPAKNCVRPTAFYPPKNGRLSAYHITTLSNDEIWRIGNEFVAPYRGPILGRADFSSLVVYQAELAIDMTGVPHPRHLDIFGWAGEKARARLQALKLANESALVMA